MCIPIRLACDIRETLALTRAGSGGGHVIDEVLQGLVLSHVQVVTGRVLHLQPLPVAVGPLVVLEQEHADHQQHTEEEHRPGDDRHQLHRPPGAAGAGPVALLRRD